MEYFPFALNLTESIAYLTALQPRDWAYRPGGFDEKYTKGRAPSWAKILWVTRILSFGDEAVMWLDADTVVLKPFSMALDEGTDFLIGTDGHGLNAGAFVIRNCDWAFRFLQDVWDFDGDGGTVKHGKDWHKGSPWEQMAIQHLVEKREHLPHVKIVEKPVWNSPTIEADTVIYHPAGVHPLEARLELLKKAAEAIRQ